MALQVYQRGLVIDSQLEPSLDRPLEVYQRGLVIDSQPRVKVGVYQISVSKGIGD